MKPLAIIPARKGSKRLPGKNRMEIGGKSLIERTILDAGMAGVFADRIVLTTDDEEFLASSASAFCHACFRGPDLAADDTPMMAVVGDVVARARRLGFCGEFDAVVLLQPTSPLRTPGDIRQAVSILAGGVDGVVSVVSTPDPELYTIGHAGRMRRLELAAALYRPNGAIFAVTTAALDAGLDWWSAPIVTAYEMPEDRSVDIDTAVDFERAKQLWELKAR